MAVIIRGKKPETCDKCWNRPSCDAYFQQVERMKQSENEQVFDVFGETRLKSCPIVGELPENHGRIVDLDKVLDWLINEKRVFSMAMSAEVDKALSDAPVILEATNHTRSTEC